MQKGEDGRPNMEPSDSYDTRQSKQRASVKWLLSKAFNNRVPENLREPFYRDHEDQEHLKPPIIGTLANAELYCLALSNMYSDPNYHNLNHWNILQTLARKGIHVPDPTDCALTETVLIQTNPLKMSAHMAVMEGLMVLYGREVGTKERVTAAVRRWGGTAPSGGAGVAGTHEEALLAWVASACQALRHQTQECESPLPNVTSIDSLRDLCDGVALAALVSLYCPDAVPASQIRAPRLASVHDSVHNLTLVQHFCQRNLPFNVFHMMPEDITYMRGSMQQNLLVMLADLFNVLEIHPAKCVRFPSSQGENSVTRSPSASHMTRGRTGGTAPGSGPQRSACSTPERRSSSPQQSPFAQDEGFVVHRGRAVPTLSSVVRQGDERVGEGMAAGRPSNWEEQRRSSYAGRRSRRSSITAADDSQLTVENFGGSQDRLNFVGRNPEKELATVNSGHHTSPRKISAPTGPIEQNVAVRSTLKDARGSIEMFYNDGDNVMHFPTKGENLHFPNKRTEEPRERFIERQYSKPEDAERVIENQHQMKRQLSNDAISHNQNIITKGSGDVTGFYLNNNNTKDSVDGDISASKMSSFADLTKFRSNGEHSGIQLVYMQHGREENQAPGNKMNRFGTAGGDGKMTFGMMPNTTTWQQQCMQNEQHQSNGDGQPPQEMLPMNNGNAMTAQINNIRLKLEEKRRRIEHEKKRMEMAYNRQRQQLGQQAFLQAVSKDISSEAQSVENKWMDQDGLPFVETRRTPDLDGMGIEDYHQSIAKMNSSLQDIQTDIARLASQQNQIQANHVIQQQVYQPPHIPQSMHNQYGSQHNVSSATYGLQHSHFGSSPHIPHDHQQMSSSPRSHQMEPSQFYLHDRPHQNIHQQHQQPVQQHQPVLQHQPVPPHQPAQQHPTPPPRRTWAQQAQVNNVDSGEQRVWPSPQSMQFQQQPQYQDANPQRGWAPQPPAPSHPQDPRTWSNMQGFLLHENSNQPYPVHTNTQPRYQNGTEHNQNTNNHLSYTVSSPQAQPSHLAVQSLFTQNTPPSVSPQHRSKTPQRQQSLGDLSHQQGAVSLQQLSAPSATHHVPMKAPSVDDMEPQNISFIGNAEDEALQQGIGRLNITSGNRTYRLPSPTRPSLTRNSFQQPLHETNNVGPASSSSDQADQTNEKGFYISFDSEQPKRPKPPLRMKRGSPKKDRTPSNNHSPERDQDHSGDEQWQERVRQPPPQQSFEAPIVQRHHQVNNMTPIIHRDIQNQSPRAHVEDKDGPAAIIIGNNPTPETAEEMERKKERIMMLSLQRRQAAEEARARSEAAAEARRQREAGVAEERAARKEQQVQRRDQILQQYKLKKAIEEAEREGKVFDKAELMSLMKPTGSQGSKGGGGPSGGGGPRLRAKGVGAGGPGGGGGARARPKTIHVDSGAVQMAEGMLLASRGKQGSSSNLTAGYSQPASSQSTMRRDYYRGSQDSLADRAGLYRDSPIDESRGMSPGSGPSILGRRGSYKTSRENVNALEPQSQTRGRSKYSTYQNNFKTGRKSSSLMNLCDSGLGRATPPRRAPSPGLRALPSPSGPGSLPPGLVTKRRTFDDGSSDISSTPSSIMDYSGPRLYKQPATKSNRGIMLNAVEYCVFPGAVNREAKRRVLEEINSSESKHFLVLFRDAGCQFRALYSFCPDREEVYKLYGTGPRQVNDRMFDKFFKYNSGSKCFSQIHTKHLTVTIDAFTIHNSLWQGKKVQLPSKKDMALVI